MNDVKTSGKHILVVDDDKGMRELLGEYLREFGYAVTLAENGREALGLYSRGAFDLVVSDLMMKPVGGMELLGELIKADPDVIFMMITGYPSIDTAMEAIKKGAKDYISKPFNADEIKLKIERVLLETSLKGRLKKSQGLVWALVISIPVWLVLGIIFTVMMN
jgi:DNA-binding NtrC family response regulator